MYQQSANPNATNSELDAKVIIKQPKLNDYQIDDIITQFVQLVVDSWDYKDLEQFQLISDLLTKH